MANNWQETSSALYLPKGKAAAAEAIIDACTRELEEDEDSGGYLGCNVSVEGKGGDRPFVWFYTDESVNSDHVEHIARELIEELEIDDVFVASFSYGCSKPRLDEFGGFAFAIKRGQPTQWCDPVREVTERIKALEYRDE
jgi:hypothetical protein